MIWYSTRKSRRVLLRRRRARRKLINFERYQTEATIVKSLLRLTEASSNYVFRPHPEVLSRCFVAGGVGG